MLPIQNILKMGSIPFKIIDSGTDLIQCDKLIIPGVGSFDPFITKLKNTGLEEVILRYFQSKMPIMGICVGAQILGHSSEEGLLKGLGILDMKTEKFKRVGNMHIPHMGWNNIKILKDNKIFSDLSDNHRFYFVHSYHFVANELGLVLAETDYGYAFPSIIGNNGIFAIQFHAEKSQKHGINLINNFVHYVD